MPLDETSPLDAPKKFPILNSDRHEKDYIRLFASMMDCPPPRSVLWSRVEVMRASCDRAHGQTLERLAERGGLGYSELYAHDFVTRGIVNGRDWFVLASRTSPADVVTWFKEWVTRSS